MSITVYNKELRKISQEFNSYKKHYNKNKHELQNIIDKNTKKELEEIQQAYDKYYAKLNALQNSNDVKELEKKISHTSKQMSASLTAAKEVYLSETKRIDNDTSLNYEEKSIKKQKIFNYILSQLYDKEERDEMNNMLQTIIIMPSIKMLDH